MKKITITSVILLAILLMLGVLIFKILPSLKKTTISKNKVLTPPTEYYQKLKESCNKQPLDNIKSCCLDSVKTMEVVGGFVVKGDKVIDNDCAKGYKRMALRCPGSYAWCQTDPDNGIPTDKSIPVPQNIPKISPLNQNNDQDQVETTHIKLPNNAISEKECSAAGGEVWNTLGETSYDGELIGRVDGLNCPCACLVRSEKSDTLWVTINGDKEEFKGNLANIKTFDDCAEAGFKITKSNPEICTVGEPYMTGGKYQTFTNNPWKTGKTCIDYHYSNCPGSCVAICTSSSCSTPNKNGGVTCTTDCDGPKSCIER